MQRHMYREGTFVTLCGIKLTDMLVVVGTLPCPECLNAWHDDGRPTKVELVDF